MKRYAYQAKDKNGQKVSGEVESTSEQEAAKLVRSRGLVVYSLRPQSRNPAYYLKALQDRVSSGDITDFTRQLATMIEAGLPITEALLVMRNQSKSEAMQKMVAQILADVEGGESLSSAMAKHPKQFNMTYVALVKSGEVGGVLDNVLIRLADTLEKQEEFKGRVKGAMIYPIIITVGMILVGLVMTIFVIPKLAGLYEEFDAELPLPTKILTGISGFILDYWYILIVLLGVLTYAFILYRRTPLGRRKTDELLFKIPIFGDLQKQVLLTEVTRTLSLMVGAGVSILEGLTITANAVNNVVISQALKDSAKDVEKGFPVAYAFARRPEAFPYILTQMMAVGEETGKVDEVLSKVSHIFEVESDQKVKALTAAFEPAIMIVLGLGVGFLVLSVILPIYNLTAHF